MVRHEDQPNGATLPEAAEAAEAAEATEAATRDLATAAGVIFTSRDQGGALARGAKRRQFDALLTYSPDAIIIVDAEGLVSEWNPAAELMLETQRLTAVGAPLRTIFFPGHGGHFDTAWQQLLDKGAAPRFEVQSSIGGGPEHRVGVIVAPVRSSGLLAGAVVILRDLTARNTMAVSHATKMEPPRGSEMTSTLAETERDGPGGLPGRRWIQRRLSEPHGTGIERGVALFDIDLFSIVTTPYGPDAADDVLHEFSELVRSLETPGTFAHLRGDVFVWMVDSLDPVEDLNECVTALTSALKVPFVVGRDEVRLTLNVGLATDALVAGGDLLAGAKDALHSARQTEGSSAVYYDESMEAGASSGFRLANDLHRAIAGGELRLHYQPIMDFATNEITGVEALVRWERPEVGLLAPGAFIDAAERTGQIVPLGNWVVRTACHDALRLGSHSGGPRTMSINVSARQLRDPSLLATLREAMLEGKTAPSTIVVEVTESVLLNDLHTVAASMEAIKALDVGLDLDDFGTGYSSLQYLRNLPIDRLKVDQGFVEGLGVNSADTAIVASTIALAHALGLQSVAEGVETTEQLDLLREMGCDFAQGYLLSRPADIEAFTTWLDAYVPAEITPTVAEAAASILQERTDAADVRDVAADGRDTRAATRDTKATIRDTEADTRDTTADRRDTTADRRDTTADRRDSNATARDTKASDRDTTADTRDRTANERERVADVRDAVADDVESEGGSSGTTQNGTDSKSTRRAAKRDRSRATADRLVEAKDRERADKGRDDASAGRTSRARARAHEKAKPVSGEEDA